MTSQSSLAYKVKANSNECPQSFIYAALILQSCQTLIVGPVFQSVRLHVHLHYLLLAAHANAVFVRDSDTTMYAYSVNPVRVCVCVRHLVVMVKVKRWGRHYVIKVLTNIEIENHKD